MNFLYFAYGSNMLTQRLVARCPSATVLGTATAQNYDLQFSKPSIDGSGKATLVGARDMQTRGVLFEIKRSDLKALDKAEGAGKGYDRLDGFDVRLDFEDRAEAVVTYLATKTNAALSPYDWYLGLVVAGAHQHELGKEHIERIRSNPHLVDKKLDRPSRIDALAALIAHGHSDHTALLAKP